MSKSGWKESVIGEHIELVYGDGLPERKRKSGQYPVYGSNGTIGFHNQPLINGPGIIVGRKGTVGQVTLSRKDFWPIDTTYYVKLKKSGDIFFWYYLLKTLGLNQMNSHSAVPGLNRDNVYSIAHKIPPLPTQRAIAKILGDLDEKIELNHQTNQTLEAIAHAIYKEWFVNFNFPGDTGEMKDSELGPIPKGWRVGGIGSLCFVQNGYAFKSDTFSDNIGDCGVIKIKNIGGNLVDVNDMQYVAAKTATTFFMSSYLVMIIKISFEIQH